MNSYKYYNLKGDVIRYWGRVGATLNGGHTSLWGGDIWAKTKTRMNLPGQDSESSSSLRNKYRRFKVRMPSEYVQEEKEGHGTKMQSLMWDKRVWPDYYSSLKAMVRNLDFILWGVF